MSTETNDGGPAFPGDRIEQQPSVHLDPLAYAVNPEQIGVRVPQGGMSLRDWFAGMALASELNTSMEDQRFKLLVAMADVGHEPVSDVIARECYTMADAMLAEREKGQSDA